MRRLTLRSVSYVAADVKVVKSVVDNIAVSLSSCVGSGAWVLSVCVAFVAATSPKAVPGVTRCPTFSFMFVPGGRFHEQGA